MLHALPGLGADRRMYPEPWSHLPNFAPHDWTKYAGEKTLAELAQSTCTACKIQDGDSLVGASLGGMVAIEIAKIRKIKMVFLVGSAMHKQEINSMFSKLQPLIYFLPIKFLQFFAAKNSHPLAQMLACAEPAFLRGISSAIFRWRGAENLATKIYRLHGKKDSVIPLRGTADLILDGGHLISMTHAKPCSDFVQMKINSGAK